MTIDPRLVGRLFEPAPMDAKLVELARRAALAGRNTLYDFLWRGVDSKRSFDIQVLPGETDNPHTVIDAHVGRALDKVWNLEAPDIPIVGEERWRSLAIGPGEYVAVADDVDGTVNAVNLVIGAATVLLVLRRYRHYPGYELVGATVAPIGGPAVLLDLTGPHLLLCHREDDGTPDEELMGEELMGATTRWPDDLKAVAAVIGRPSQRDKLEKVAKAIPDHVLFTLGGAPTLPALFRRGLRATIALKSQTLYDGVHTLIAPWGGLTVTNLRGDTITWEEMRAWVFSWEQGKDYKPVPPHIVAKSPLIAWTLAEALSKFDIL